jgi:hypothetical protein
VRGCKESETMKQNHQEVLTRPILSDLRQDGVKIPAHSAVLASIPYFEAKLRDDWCGIGWNLNEKLELHLPCPVNQQVVQAFLKYAYGDFQSLYQIESSDAPFCQVTLSDFTESGGTQSRTEHFDRV